MEMRKKSLFIWRMERKSPGSLQQRQNVNLVVVCRIGLYNKVVCQCQQNGIFLRRCATSVETI